MNERTEKLLEQARTACSQFGSKPATTVGYDELEKFAQLSISDCIQTLINNGYDDAAKCLQDIHFGIDYPV